MVLRSVRELRDDIRAALEPTIGLRRSGVAYYAATEPDFEEQEPRSGPIGEDEIDEFIEVNPLFEPHVRDALVEPSILGFENKRLQLSAEFLENFEESLSWSEVQDWYAADDTMAAITSLAHDGLIERVRAPEFSLHNPPSGFSGTLVTSPSLIFLANELIKQGKRLNELDPRQFEELIAELLQRDGWDVLLTPKTKDGGVDVIAERRDPLIGRIRSVWEAKRYGEGRKVRLATVRELSASVVDHSATKGVIVTTGNLTGPALSYVEQQSYRLSVKEYGNVLDWLLGRVQLD